MKNQNEINANQQIVSCLLADYWQQVREKLCPLLENEVGVELTDTLRRLTQILEIVRIEENVPAPTRGKRGNPTIDRRPIARAFVAKAVLNLSATRQLIEQLHQSPVLRLLCGMEQVPSEATFSRAFGAFAQQDLGGIVHHALVEKLVSGQVVMHVSHDATAVEAREKATKKVKIVREKKPW